MQKRQQQTFETQAKDNMKNDVKKCAFRQTQRCTKHQCKDDVDWINRCTTIGEKSNTGSPRKTRWDSRVQGRKNGRKTIIGKLAYPGLYNYKSTANQPWMPPPEQVCTDRQTTPKHNASSPIYWMVKGSLYSTTERRVLELIPVLGNQPAGEVSHTPSGRLPLLSARPTIRLAA